MFCSVCCQRWASLDYTTLEERFEAFESNKIRVCGDPECFDIIDRNLGTDLYERLVKEAKEFLEKNPTANRMEE